ncbi:RIP metalloprotease RseP [Rhodocyclus tenuis]|uniref:Zinc metalloprotease n=1 Tax=Rhodocyclus tenuis TaxID=1066 RepID=A0A840G801_RHOTE|nr:RIP metalloprotease RseP [Rhodocyclus tenuis]MBB4247070.1 regulator of sigma E protease [Rhodocyclus tenuis]
MSNLLTTLAAFLLAIGLLVVVHEFGHYFVARRLGVKVLSFSLGFGKPLWSRRWGADRTEWVIAALPLGGFVRMLDEREGEVDPGERHRAFNRQSPWRRMAIVVAGPAANFLLAILLYWGVFATGVEEPRAWLGTPPAASAAADAGVRAGERVLKVGDVAVDTWQDVRWSMLQQSLERDSVDLEVIDEHARISIRRIDMLVVREAGWEGDPLGRVGLMLGHPRTPPVLGKVAGNSAAAKAGLLAGDLIVAVDGQPLDDWSELVNVIRAAPGRTLRLDFRRDGVPLATSVTIASETRNGKEIGRIGVNVLSDGAEKDAWLTTVRYPPAIALGKAVMETWEKSVFSLVMMGRMLTGDVSWRNLSGPVTIANYAGQSARLGIDYYVRFLALVSLSLGVLNLLPIPILDGGHLLYYLAELIRRAPASERATEIGQRIGIALMFLLMVFAFYNDISRLVSG